MMRCALARASAWASVLAHDEIHTGQPRRDHVVDRVAACTADTENGDAGLQFLDIRDGEVDGHDGPMSGVWDHV